MVFNVHYPIHYTKHLQIFNIFGHTEVPNSISCVLQTKQALVEQDITNMNMGVVESVLCYPGLYRTKWTPKCVVITVAKYQWKPTLTHWLLLSKASLRQSLYKHERPLKFKTSPQPDKAMKPGINQHHRTTSALLALLQQRTCLYYWLYCWK